MLYKFTFHSKTINQEVHTVVRITGDYICIMQVRIGERKRKLYTYGRELRKEIIAELHRRGS